MLFLYNIGIRLYYAAIYIASVFNSKAKLWIKGRSNQHFTATDGCTWFHFASLGEFEQGRPVLEALKAKEPGIKIIVTFFSPSGYEIRKNTTLADAVYYLPLDTAKNAKNFIQIIKPKQAIFTKYEYWYHYFNELQKQHVPLYIISGIFRPGQVFFKWYGSLHRRMLKMVSHFFVQDQRSVDLLRTINITNATLSGDTRFDRVWANAANPKAFPEIVVFKGDQNLFIAGSTWPDDEKLLAGLITDNPGWKWIIAPHEISEQKINDLLRLLPADKTILFSQLSDLQAHVSILVIDNIGMLSSLYQYGEIAYIGGGFGRGIHNILEAAAFGLPVIFGPNYSAFKEAKDVIRVKAGFSISNAEELRSVAQPLMNDAGYCESAGRKAQTYVEQHIGATGRILNAIV